MRTISSSAARRRLLLALGVLPLAGLAQGAAPAAAAPLAEVQVWKDPSYNSGKNPYSVMLVAKNGSASVYQKYEGNNL